MKDTAEGFPKHGTRLLKLGLGLGWDGLETFQSSSYSSPVIEDQT